MNADAVLQFALGTKKVATKDGVFDEVYFRELVEMVWRDIAK